MLSNTFNDMLGNLRSEAAQKSVMLQPDVSRATKFVLPAELGPTGEPKLEVTNVPKGVVFIDLASSIAQHGNLIGNYLAKAVGIEDKLSALNLTHFNGGAFLYVPSNTDATLPLSMFMAVDAGSRMWTRNIIVLENGSRLNVTEDIMSTFTGSNESALLGNVFEIFLGNDAELNVSTVQNLSPNVTFLRQARALLGRDARLNVTTATLGGGLVRSKRDTVFNEPGSSVSDVEVFFGSGWQHFDLTTNVFHKKPQTKSDVLVKGILSGNARALAYGLTRIDKAAKGADAFLAEHGLLLSETARCDTTPSLEIEEADVKAGHSASVSQIDESQMFYLESRGLNKDAARKLIALGFLQPAAARLPATIKEQIAEIIEQKWDTHD